jgi:thiosulfate/3-mercaptopyruvate sulfurtransferase
MVPTLLLLFTLTAEPVKPMLAEPAEITASPALIIDVRNVKPFEDGHLPGAIPLRTTDWAKAVVDGKADANYWSVQLAEIGLTPNRGVIVSGDDMREVCRCWWLLRYAGVEDVRVLNGPVKLFADAGGMLATGPAKATPVKVTEWKHAPHRQVHKDDVLARATGKEKDVVIDGRSPEEYQDGRVPKAKHLEWSETLDAKTGKFKSVDELKKLFASRGIDPSESPLCYCQSGGRASVVAFASELVSGKPARNYYRSWSEWSQDDALPKEK